TKKMATTLAATKRNEVSKSASNVKSNTALAKVDAKPPLKPQQYINPNASKKPAAVAARFPGVNRVQTPPGSPVSMSSSSAPNTPRSKQAHKPTQAVTRLPASKRTQKTGAAAVAPVAAVAASAVAPVAAVAAAAVAPVAAVAAAAVAPATVAAVAPVATATVAPVATAAVAPVATAAVAPVATATVAPVAAAAVAQETQVEAVEPLPQGLKLEQQQPSVRSPPTDVPPSAESSVSPVTLLLQPEALLIETQMSQPTAVAENGSPEVILPNQDDDEGSQLVSFSEMSGTTQPTEESRPGSAGPVGASAWRMGGALLSELDSEEVSVSQQGASELSAPGVLEGTESMDDLGEGSLKGAMDMEGASAGSPDFEKVPEIPVNDYDDEEEEDDNDRVCDMDVGSERTDELQRLRHDNDVDDEEDEDEDVEMASEGVTESGLESYGNADEDDFAEDERLDNLNRVAQPPPPPPLLPSAPAAQWDQPNPFPDPWAEPTGQGAEAAPESPLTDPCLGDSETPTQEPAQTWLELGLYLEELCAAAEPTLSISPSCAPGTFPLIIVCSGTPNEVDHGHTEKDVLVPQPELPFGGELVGAPVAEALGSHAPASNHSSSSSVTEDEASDMEGEAQLEDSLETPAICNVTYETLPQGQRCLSTVEESEEPEDSGAVGDTTPLSATSQVSYGFDATTSVSNSNAQSTGENCVKSPGIFSLEELPEEAKEPPAQPSVLEQPYIVCGKGEADCEMANSDKVCSPSPEPQQLEQMNPLDDIQPAYYSAICENTENSFTGFSAALLHPQRRDHSSYPRTYCDIVKPVNAALSSPKLSCADLPPRSPKQQPLSPQLRRLEQHQRHLLELQQRREQQSRPLEEAEQERKKREEEEEQELEQRKALEMQLHQQEEELKQRQQIMQWQQELQESNKPLLLSPSSGLCTIYEALENSDDEENGAAKCEEETVKELNSVAEMGSDTGQEADGGCGTVTPEPQSTHSSQDVQQRLTPPIQNGDSSSTPESPDRPSPLELDWDKKVDIVHQLINQTLLLNGDSCSSLLLLPGGAGGTLSPLESSLWPSLLPPLTPPSATVTSVSSFSPETSGTSPQGEWTVVELETHH
uniref:BTB/POZ domain-containing protein n=1 Tax=Neogobius melanostomus TaxID=47308 RepID=A0A8C6SXQ9_9GOBI